MDKNFLDTLSKDGEIYLIRSAEDLCNLSEYVNAGNDCKEKIFKLANDIDLRGVENFTPIGTGKNLFAGTFDGDGKTISNLKIVGENHVGLFGCNAGNINNVNLSDVKVKGEYFTGGLVGCNCDKIESCSINGTVSGNEYVGGLVGNNWDTIQNCSTSGNISGTNKVGGFIGSNVGTIENCSASGNVVGKEWVSDLVGWNIGRIENCLASGNVSGNMNVGGLVGSNDSDIENCTFSGSVSKRDEII